MTTLPQPSEMYDALVERDVAYDGLFIVGVKTTGIFCRPTCPARKPKPENVEFFSSASDALHAGYRPCQRCRPLDHAGRPPQWLRELVELVDAEPSRRLTEGSLRAMALEPATVRRGFQRHYGMTFHAYQRARRMGAAFTELRNGNDVLTAGSEAGYDSASGFHEAFTKLFGNTPGASETGCAFARWIDTPIGAMLAVANDDGLLLLEFVMRRGLARQIETLRKRADITIVPGAHEYLNQVEEELKQYFAAARFTFTVPIHMPGSAFQRDVWNALCDIPAGETSTYAALAEAVGRPGAHRAVGRANGDNRLAIIVPCHRVVRSDGSLCGYGGGKWRKQWLLDHERGALVYC